MRNEVRRDYQDYNRGEAVGRPESVPMLDVSATYDEGENRCAVFLLNRDLEQVDKAR